MLETCKFASISAGVAAWLAPSSVQVLGFRRDRNWASSERHSALSASICARQSDVILPCTLLWPSLQVLSTMKLFLLLVLPFALCQDDMSFRTDGDDSPLDKADEGRVPKAAAMVECDGDKSSPYHSPLL